MTLPGSRRLSLILHRCSSLQSYTGAPSPTGADLMLPGRSPCRMRTATSAALRPSSWVETRGSPDNALAEIAVEVAEYGRVCRFPKSRQHAILLIRYPSRIHAHTRIEQGRARRQGGGALHQGQVIEPFERHSLPPDRVETLVAFLHPKWVQWRRANHEHDVRLCLAMYWRMLLDKLWQVQRAGDSSLVRRQCGFSERSLIGTRDEQRRRRKELRSILLKEAGCGRAHSDNEIEIATSKESTNVVYQRRFLGRLRQPCHLKRGFVEIDRWQPSCEFLAEACRDRAPGLEVRSKRVQ